MKTSERRTVLENNSSNDFLRWEKKQQEFRKQVRAMEKLGALLEEGKALIYKE